MMPESFQQQLLPGEQVLWSGQGARKLFAPIDIFLVPFSVLWAGGAIVWEVVVLFTMFSNETPLAMAIIFPLFGLLFVVAGLYFSIGRFWYKDWRRRNTFYAVTDRRVLIHYRNQIQALYLDSLPILDLSVSSTSGIGTIRFGQVPFMGGLYIGTGLEFLPFGGGNVPAFWNISDARKVYELISATRDRLRSR